MTTSKRFQILVCDGPSCGLCLGSEALLDHIQRRVEASDSLRERVVAINLTCFGRCDDGPNLLVRELGEGEDGEFEPEIEDIEGVRGLYLGNDVAQIDRVLDEHCETGEPIEDFVEIY
jgi:(2Fe-2S) ferredoxin